ncbi:MULTISPECIES: hypothetical protein [unclassified Streptomyces]|uniref:hypothetical protein n=1 Tax=unclassified Streptomyces TaxID=2593676 RepID=UPI002E17600D|nr:MULTISPECIES: hypothetical protein [unclassified Streptomyces]
MSAICRFIHAEKAAYPVTLLCRVMKTARSTYYAWATGIEAREKRERADTALARRLRKHVHWGYLTPHETRLRYQQGQALAA